MTEPVDPRKTVRRLVDAGEHLSDELRGRILLLGAAAVAPLIELLEDEALASASSPGAGYAPIHAADLLGALRAAEAVEPMLRVLARTDWMDVLHDRLLQALPAIGPAVVEPCLRAHEASQDPERRSALRSVLSRAGVRDDRILALLLEGLEADTVPGAADLAEYGDPRVLPRLSRALDAIEVDEAGDPLANGAIIELAAAVEDLGGVLTRSQAAKRARVRDAATPAEVESDLDEAWEAPPDPVRRPPGPGRNEPCWCGSGRKYKKCHLAQDEAASR